MGRKPPFGKTHPSEGQERPFHARRRSERISLGMSLVVYGHRRENEPFREEAQTLTVSAHGALVSMATPVAKGQKLILTNLQNMHEARCHVAYLGPTQHGKTRIGLEFIHPFPRFWGIAKPPEDWVLAEYDH
jgi:PilZ domain-containing protein